MDEQSLTDFLSLPVNPQETWQGGVATLAKLMGLPPGNASSGMGLILWRSMPSEFVHAKPMLGDDDPFVHFANGMLELSEEHEVPSRPARIDCNDRRLADELGRRLDGSGTAVRYQAEMDGWNASIRSLAEHLMRTAPPPLPSLREAGCSDEQIREFAAAASEFYQAKLWETLDDVDLIKIETPKPPRHLRYAVVLGAGGQSYGLGLYKDADDHYSLMAQTADPHRLSLFSFAYESPADVASGDVGLWRELDLPLETGEAFPDANYYSADGPRRPTATELSFLTLVLRALAQTSEAELDSGRWTQSIQVAGKRKKCAFSIPNLLDPPDRAEWIRRGKMPEQRSHEVLFRQVQDYIDSAGQGMGIDELNQAINARFVGRPLDELELPRNTPAERAEALCQEALNAFGRRRIILARQALAEDPHHVEAGILVAESTHAADRQIELFQNAKQAAAVALGNDMEELAGQFWGFHETRPYMRACHGLAIAYADAGQYGDAVEQYRDMLRLNPNDNQGVRYEVVPLLLEQGRDAEAIEVLDRYPEESAQWLYAKALVEFRRGGGSTAAKKALHAAFRANDQVLRLLQSDEPPLAPTSYSHGSPEEASICIEELEAIWDETEGYMKWMFQEYFLWERDRAKRLRDQKRKTRQQTKRKGKR